MKYKLREYAPFWIFIGIFMGLLTWIGLSAIDPHTPVAKVSTNKVQHLWVRSDSLSFALDQLESNTNKQFVCLKNLWGKESAWNPHAKNYVKSQGLNAGGIPQLLGLNPLTMPSEQIRRGLRYIEYRYVTPCIAWQHWQQKGWY